MIVDISLNTALVFVFFSVSLSRLKKRRILWENVLDCISSFVCIECTLVEMGELWKRYHRWGQLIVLDRFLYLALIDYSAIITVYFYGHWKYSWQPVFFKMFQNVSKCFLKCLFWFFFFRQILPHCAGIFIPRFHQFDIMFQGVCYIFPSHLCRARVKIPWDGYWWQSRLFNDGRFSGFCFSLIWTS